MGVPTTRRYAGGREVTVGKTWLPSRINNMVRNTVYRGLHTFEAKSGPIEREVPALIDDATWQRANRQLGRNRALAKRNAKHDYLLRGLIRCASCGMGFVGTASRDRRTGWEARYYRCGSQLGSLNPEIAKRCRSKNVPARWIEDLVWADIRGFVLNPGEALAEAQEQARARQIDSDRLERERIALARQVAEKSAERERVTTLTRRGVIDLDEATSQLDQMKKESDALRFRLAEVDAQLNEAANAESKYAQAEELLAGLADRVGEIEAANDRVKMRRLVEFLVVGLEVVTTGTGSKKEGLVRFRYAFGREHVVNTSTGRHGCTQHTGSGTT
jgi:site-specific DNA recombinase